MQNFATPYFSRNIAEFWRRWHISLSTWFRDYLYIPLGGSRGGSVFQIKNVFIIFIVSGFWHGANWTYIFWGFIHALCYIPQVFMNTNRKYLNTVAMDSYLPSVSDLFRMVSTFIIAMIAWVFFRSDTLGASFVYLKNMFYSGSLTNDIVDLKLETSLLPKLFVFIVFLITIEWLNRTRSHGLSKMINNNLVRYTFYFLISFLILEYFSGQSQFIYFQF